MTDNLPEKTMENPLVKLENTQKLCSMLMQQKHYAKMGEDGIFAIVSRAKSLNIDPLEALNGGLYFVSGKVGMSTEMMASLVRESGHSVIKDEKSTNTCCILRGKRKDNGDTWTVSFSIEDAKRAGIYNERGTWGKYPSVMLYNRCMSILCRQLFPDVIKGAGYTYDELNEIRDNKPKTIEEIPEETLSEAQVEEITAKLRDYPDFERSLLERLKKAFGCDSWDKVPAKQIMSIHKVVDDHLNEVREAQLAEMEKLDIPPVDEFLEILTASGTKLWGCKLAMDMFHVTKDDLIDDLDGVLTVGEFYERAKGDGTHILFI